MYRILKLKQLDHGSGNTQINSTTLVQGPGINSGFSGTTITDALNYLQQLASEQHVSKLVISDKNITGCSTSNNSMISNFSITYKPTNDSRVDLRVNGVVYSVGQTQGNDLYFSSDNGSTAIPFNSLSGGEELFWKYTTIGFNIETTDILELDYEKDDIIYTNGALAGISYLTFTFSGDNSTTVFDFPHTYGYTLPKVFSGYDNTTGTYELFDFEDIKLLNNLIRITFTVPPANTHTYKFVVGF